MKMTKGELKNAEQALHRIMTSPTDFKLAYRLGKILKKVNVELVALEEARIKLIDKYGEKDEKKGMKVPEANMEVFTKEYTAILAEEIDLDVVPVPMDLLERSGIKITTVELNAVEKLIETLKEEEAKIEVK